MLKTQYRWLSHEWGGHYTLCLSVSYNYRIGFPIKRLLYRMCEIRSDLKTACCRNVTQQRSGCWHYLSRLVTLYFKHIIIFQPPLLPCWSSQWRKTKTNLYYVRVLRDRQYALATTKHTPVNATWSATRGIRTPFLQCYTMGLAND